MDELQLITKISESTSNLVPAILLYMAVMVHRLEKKFTTYFMDNEISKANIKNEINLLKDKVK